MNPELFRDRLNKREFLEYTCNSERPLPVNVILRPVFRRSNADMMSDNESLPNLSDLNNANMSPTITSIHPSMFGLGNTDVLCANTSLHSSMLGLDNTDMSPENRCFKPEYRSVLFELLSTTNRINN